MASHAWLSDVSDKADIIEVYDHYLRKNAAGHVTTVALGTTVDSKYHTIIH